MLELSERGRDLETELQDLLLALKTNVLGPLDHAGDIALRLNVLANTVVARASLDERVLGSSAPEPSVNTGREGVKTNLGGLLGASLSLREWGRGRLLARFRGLSLRKEDISEMNQAKRSSLNSNEKVLQHFCASTFSSQFCAMLFE